MIVLTTPQQNQPYNIVAMLMENIMERMEQLLIRKRNKKNVNPQNQGKNGIMSIVQKHW